MDLGQGKEGRGDSGIKIQIFSRTNIGFSIL